MEQEKQERNSRIARLVVGTVVTGTIEQIMPEVKEKSEYIRHALIGSEGIKSVSGMGLMIGIETCADAKKIVNKCIEKGVLCLLAKNKVRLLPALNIPMDVLEKAINIIKEACK